MYYCKKNVIFEFQNFQFDTKTSIQLLIRQN